MKVRFYSFWVNRPPTEFWGEQDWDVTVDIPDGARVICAVPSSVGYEVILMEEVPDE